MARVTPVTFYIALIVLVNYGFSVVPMIETPWGDMLPPATIVVGLVFVARDYAQRAIGHFVLIAMLFAGLISYFMADPFIAIASVIAFAISELVDWLVFSFSKKPFRSRILLSSLLSTPIDSAVFLSMISAFSWSAVAAMFVAKMAGALIVWRLIK